MTDWKALCEELLQAWEVELGELSESNRLCRRARAALAQPEPEVAEQRHLAPVPVSERPWEREGWCHEQERWAWFYNRRVGWRDAIPPESLKPPTLFPYTHSLPFNALPLPQGEVQP